MENFNYGYNDGRHNTSLKIIPNKDEIEERVFNPTKEQFTTKKWSRDWLKEWENELKIKEWQSTNEKEK